MPRTEATICRVCHAQCPATVTVDDDGRATHLDGIRGHPVYHGYACAKGRALPSYHYMPERLTATRHRRADGTFADVASSAAIADVAARLRALIDEHGPRSVALYNGTHGYNNFLSSAFAFSFMEAIGSPMVFTSVTIDQPGKAVSGALHGTWLAGHATIDEADCWMFVGANPVISMLGPVNPAHALKRNQARGMQLIVIDPRRTEVARRADVFLQAKPANDALLLAAMIKIVLDEGLADDEFVAAHTEGRAALEDVLAELDIAAVAERAGIAPDDLIRAARTYASAKRGVVAVGTGPNMAGHGNLTEYLSRVLMSVCGHWLRPGDRFANPGALLHPLPPIAAASGTSPGWGFGETLRVRGLTDTAAGMPTAALADEILLDGKGQVRALIVVGGNPLLAWPDQIKTRAALERLDLLVCLDTLHSATGRLAAYTVAVKTHLEVSGLSALQEACRAYIGWGYWAPYAQYCYPAVEPPAGADLIEEWEFFRGVADALDVRLTLRPASYAFDPERQAELAFELDPGETLTTDALYDRLFVDSPVPLDAIRRYPEGHVFEREPVFVEAPESDTGARLEIGNADMLDELDAALAESDERSGFPFRLVSRRLPDIVNSSWRPNPVTLRRWPYNPAFMHPDDLAELDLESGDTVRIESERASIDGVVEAAPDVRRGVISMSHCWGDDAGSNTGRLSANDRDFDPHTGIPRMSAIPVRVCRSGSDRRG